MAPKGNRRNRKILLACSNIVDEIWGLEKSKEHAPCSANYLGRFSSEQMY